MKAIPTTLKIDWEDGVTVEVRYFPSRRSAMEYARKKCNGLKTRFENCFL